jgi:hypothetical protein
MEVLEVNANPDEQNVQDTESAAFSAWYFPILQAVHSLAVVVHSFPALHCLHVTESAVF